MSTQQQQYSSLMQQFDDALGDGDFAAALRTAQEATRFTTSETEAAIAHQKQGIARRLAGNFTDAIESFKAALALLPRGEHLLESGMRRDLAMVYIDQIPHFHDGARQHLGRMALDQLDASMGAAMKSMGQANSDAAELEYHASLGFKGRLDYTLGSHKVASTYLGAAHRMFGELDSTTARTYELNNLVWLLKVERKFEYLRRGLELVKQTGDTRRKKEILILFFVGDAAYRLTRKVYGALKRRK